jgi:hypothetical protein
MAASGSPAFSAAITPSRTSGSLALSPPGTLAGHRCHDLGSMFQDQDAVARIIHPRRQLPLASVIRSPSGTTKMRLKKRRPRECEDGFGQSRQ